MNNLEKWNEALEEQAKLKGWSKKAEVAQRLFPSANANSAEKKLKEWVIRQAPEKFKLLYDRNSVYYASRNHFSKEQVRLIEVILKAEKVKGEKDNKKVRDCIKVRKVTFAGRLFPNLIPEVAAKRMDLMLERNFKRLKMIYRDEEEQDSESLTLDQCFEIARIFDSVQALDWTEKKMTEEIKSKPELFKIAVEEEVFPKSDVIMAITSASDYRKAYYQFYKMLDSVPGLSEKVFPTEQIKRRQKLTETQMKILTRYFPELQTLCYQ